MNKPDSCIYYANKALEVVKGRRFYAAIIDANVLLSHIYENRDAQKALDYNKTAMLYKDSLSDRAKLVSAENLIAYDEQERQYEIETAKAAYRNRVKLYVWTGSLLVSLLIAFLLYRNNLHKQKAKLKIEKAYKELKATQAQLIQREKMASLGELTAGIAHEIQNPLNFVNNFSEVSQELSEELEQEVAADHKEEVLDLVADLRQNLQKIRHHGQRADAIVKNMLQHSRSTAGEKQLTNLNALAEEYLRLAYHGLRAKDKDFTCTLDTCFDLKLPQVEVVPEEIGRVLLNLYNNAFYALQQKAKLVPAGAEGEGAAGYQPTVKVSTRMNGDWVELRVRDNGVGVPEAVKGKIFQPFFTTKAPGEGTGLGLSLSYDIITKGHGGELKVDSEEGEHSEFVVELPLSISSAV